MARNSQGLRLDPDEASASLVVREPVQVGQRARLGLPAEVVRHVSWMTESRAGDQVYALGIFDEPGRLLLKNWDTESGPILQRQKTLIEQGSWVELAQLEDLFRRLQVSKDGRMTLTTTHLLHLGISAESAPWVFVTTNGNWIEIASVTYRNTKLESARAAFSDLLDSDGQEQATPPR